MDDVGDDAPVAANGAQRRARLRTCHRHLGPDGRLVRQRHGPRWFDTAAPCRHTEGPGLMGVEQPAPTLLTTAMRHPVGDRERTHMYGAWPDVRAA
jgi:hypothetical protein